ncbi:MAG: hemin uptake protein HemP [Proteobacteria bacterium]|nr:MAG: hemin uptake protein HemP [Pseudomonadota bacterium]
MDHTDLGAPVRNGAEQRTVRARDLLGPERILRIEHEGQVYTLRITRNERLILTK